MVDGYRSEDYYSPFFFVVLFGVAAVLVDADFATGASSEESASPREAKYEAARKPPRMVIRAKAPIPNMGLSFMYFWNQADVDNGVD